MKTPIDQLNGTLLINKHAGVTSFGIIELLQKSLMDAYGVRRRDLPKLGHGGTLDPFATGLLPLCVGKGVKLARYFLGASKVYEGTIRFGETTVPGDPTDPISERSEHLPKSLGELQELADRLASEPYSQTPPMHSAKKKDGKPLYELARLGIEVEREPKVCHLHEFKLWDYKPPCVEFRLYCSTGTYVRTLSQDFARLLGTVGMLERLERTATAGLKLENSWTLQQIQEALGAGQSLNQLPCWVDFDRLLDGYTHSEASTEERDALYKGQQNVLFSILNRAVPPQDAARDLGNKDCIAIHCQGRLVAVARLVNQVWGLERVFTPVSESATSFSADSTAADSTCDNSIAAESAPAIAKAAEQL